MDCFTQIIKDSLEEASNIQNKQEAMEYLIKYINISYLRLETITKEDKIKYINTLLINDFLPHLNSNDLSNIKIYKKKGIFTSYMVQKLLLTHFICNNSIPNKMVEFWNNDLYIVWDVIKKDNVSGTPQKKELVI